MMKTYHFKVALSDVIPFAERRKAFILFLRKKRITLEKLSFFRGLGLFINITTLKKLSKAYSKIPQKDISKLTHKAFLDVENYLKKD